MKCPDTEYFLLKNMSDIHVSAGLPDLGLLSCNSCWSLKQTPDCTGTDVHVLCLFSPSVVYVSFRPWMGGHFQVCPTLCHSVLFSSSEPDSSLCSWENARIDFMPLGMLLTVNKFVLSTLCGFISFICALFYFHYWLRFLKARVELCFLFLFFFSHSILSMPLRT